MVHTLQYADGISILSQSREFVRLCAGGIAGALGLLRRESPASYTWHRLRARE
jgi:hypothetical protein